MAARIIATASEPNGTKTVIRRDTEWNQYIVQFFRGDEYLSKADYFTTDRVDAFDTAAHFRRTNNG
jgi:hypothetical protein